MEPSIPADAEQQLAALRADYEAVKTRLTQVGFICEGSLVQRYMPCGKPGCRCADPAQRHGPYWQLSYKRDGKTVSRRLSAAHAAHYQEWIANRHQLEAVIAQLHAVSRSAHPYLLGGAEHAITPPADPPSGPPAGS